MKLLVWIAAILIVLAASGWSTILVAYIYGYASGEHINSILVFLGIATVSLITIITIAFTQKRKRNEHL